MSDLPIHTVEGSVIFGPVNTGGGDFVGRDQIKRSPGN